MPCLRVPGRSCPWIFPIIGHTHSSGSRKYLPITSSKGKKKVKSGVGDGGGRTTLSPKITTDRVTSSPAKSPKASRSPKAPRSPALSSSRSNMSRDPSENDSICTKNGFTDKEKSDLKQAFDLFDKNADGKISSDELSSVIKVLRFNISDKEIEEMIKIVDKNENGFVDYDEYLSLMKRFSSTGSKEQTDDKTMEAFKVFDIDGNGYIDRQELRYVMRRLGENLSEEDVREMFKEADLNGDGKIDFKEFSRLLYQLT